MRFLKSKKTIALLISIILIAGNDFALFNTAEVCAAGSAPILSLDTKTGESVTLKWSDEEISNISNFTLSRATSKNGTYTVVRDNIPVITGGTPIEGGGNTTTILDETFNTFTAGIKDGHNLVDSYGWGLPVEGRYYVATVANVNSKDALEHLWKSGLENLDGNFALIGSQNYANALTYKGASDISDKGTFSIDVAFPRWSNNNTATANPRPATDTYIYLGDDSIAEETEEFYDAPDSGVAIKIKYDVSNKAIFLNDKKVITFSDTVDEETRLWNHFDFEIDKAARKIIYKMFRYSDEGQIIDEDSGDLAFETEVTGNLSTVAYYGRGWACAAIDNIQLISGARYSGSMFAYLDNDLLPERTYYYKVTANAGTDTIVSNTLGVKTYTILPSSFDLDDTPINLAIGSETSATKTLPGVTVMPVKAVNKNYTWSSAPASIAAVDTKAGTVSGKGFGSATLTVTAAASSAVKATVPVNVTQIILNQTSLDINCKESFELTADVQPTTKVENQNITWESSSPEIASVDQTGKVTGISEGMAVITAIGENAGERTGCTVNVHTVPATGIKLNKQNLSLKEGQKEKLIATPEPDNTSDTVIWSSLNQTVVSVDQDGNVTALKAGTATITAEIGEFSDSCFITVSPTSIPANSIKFIKKPITLKKVGDTEILRVTLNPTNTTDKSNWISDKPNIVSVNQDGKITANKTGSAVITVTTTSGQKDTCKVTVKSPSKKLTLNKTRISLNKGRKYTLKATMTPKDTTDKLTCKSNKPKTVSISKLKINTKNKNVGTVVIKAKKKGKATITFKTTNGKIAKCYVTVK